MPDSSEIEFEDSLTTRRPRAPELRLVRMRLLVCLGGTAITSLMVGGLIVIFVTPGLQPLVSGAVHRAPTPLLDAVAAALIVVLVLIVALVRQILAPAEELARSRGEIHELYQAERSNALSDSLTGLGNHRAFQEAFDRHLHRVQSAGTSLALVLIDLDEFKLVNDSAGHAVGDELLAEFASRLSLALRRGDEAYRVGGDEFALLLPGTDADGAAIVARRLLAATTDTHPGGRFARPFSFSAGISASPADGLDRTRLYALADTAMYDVKRHGRTGVRIFDPAHAPNVLGEVDQALRATAVVELVRSSALRAVYQPLVNLRTGEVVGFEGLVRPLSDSGFANAGQLFEAAELAGRTYDLDLVCIETVAANIGGLGPEQFLSVNLSPRTIEAPEFSAALLVRVLARHGLSPSRVILELTERETVDDLDRVRSVLGACQSLGMRIAADDVGAGNAGLRLLSQIHFDIVKIDLSLVQAGSRAKSSAAILGSLRDLAAQWGAVAVAEGVETVEQLRLVRDLPIGEGQGYLLGRPGPKLSPRTIDLEALLREDLATPWSRLGITAPVAVG